MKSHVIEGEGEEEEGRGEMKGERKMAPLLGKVPAGNEYSGIPAIADREATESENQTLTSC